MPPARQREGTLTLHYESSGVVKFSVPRCDITHHTHSTHLYCSVAPQWDLEGSENPHNIMLAVLAVP